MANSKIVLINENHYWYRYRGLISVSDRCKTKEQLLDESFIHEFTKQVTPQISKILDTPIGKLTKKGEFEFAQYLWNDNSCTISTTSGLYLRVDLHVNIAGSTIWVKCVGEHNPVDPRSSVANEKLTFTVVLGLPEDVRLLAYSYMLEWIKSEPDPIRKDELSESYNKLITKTHNDSWIVFLKEWL